MLKQRCVVDSIFDLLMNGGLQVKNVVYFLSSHGYTQRRTECPHCIVGYDHDAVCTCWSVEYRSTWYMRKVEVVSVTHCVSVAVNELGSGTEHHR